MGINFRRPRVCRTCSAELQTRKEKLTGTCNDCASKANKAFEKMGSGKFKEGLNEILDLRFPKANGEKRAVIKAKLAKAYKKKYGRIKKKLEKKGLSQEEIESGTKKFEEVE